LKLGQKIQLFSHSIFLRLSQINGLVGAGALVVGLAIFAFATKKNNGKIGSKK